LVSLPLPPLFRVHNAKLRTGTTVKIHGEVIQVGKTMAMIRGTMSSLDDKTVYSTCEHHKVAVPTQPKHLEYRVNGDDLWDKESVEGIKEREKSRL
jgi:acyl-coenzyme A thioesterase 13